jgi:hypothetical protein
MVVGCANFDVSGLEEDCRPVKSHSNSFLWSYCPRVFGIDFVSSGYYKMIIIVPSILQCGAMIASILTVCELVKVFLNPVSEDVGRRNKRMKSSIKILLTNLGSFLHVLIMMITAGFSETTIHFKLPLQWAIIYLMFQTLIPAMISILNPIIYMILTPEFECNMKLKNCTSVVEHSSDRAVN